MSFAKVEDALKNAIKQIKEKLESQDFIGLDKVKEDITVSTSGFYWIYTKLPLKKFAEASAPSNDAHVDFALLANIHSELKHVICQTDGEYWCIYNGKGKQLKSRIVAQFSNTEATTGKLALQRCFKEADFKVKYISCESVDGQHGVCEKYDTLKRDLERVWRLDNGWPFLCRK